MTSGSDQDDLHFQLEDAPSAAATSPLRDWAVLVVDDDASVHSITRLVLEGVRFQGRGIEVISAMSRNEASALLRRRGDIALILLDVVMESDDAGLRLVREVRDEIGNRAVRIILRTGEPGQAPERRVILDYDINDYKSKADLTAQSLFTAIIAALRGYADILTVEQSRQGLARLFSGSAWLFTKTEIAGFAAAVLQLVASLFDAPIDAALLLGGDHGWQVVAGLGRLADSSLETLPSSIAIALAVGAPVSTPEMELRPIHCLRHKSASLLVIPSLPINRVSRDLLDMVSATIGVGLDNGALHLALLNERAFLEQRVAERTAELAEINRALRTSQSMLEEDLRAAGVLQQAILPNGFPAHPHVQGAAVMRPALKIGGDFFDVMALHANRVAMLVGDVSGKGAQAALFMFLVRALLRDAMEQQGTSGLFDPAVIMAETNRRLIAHNPLSLFVTVMFCVLDTATGRVRFCSAGHGMPLIRSASCEVVRVTGRPSPMLGLIEAARFSTLEIQLAAGDAIVLNTDGIEEASSPIGECFGTERLQLALSASGLDATASDILDTLLAALAQFHADLPLDDDVTCVVARWAP